MSRQINQPSNQIKLTNVSIVRLRKGKKRFEVACYKNKVLEYRQGLEKDLDSVLQIGQVFLNVSKGQTASKPDIEKAFGKGVTSSKAAEEILRKGEIQVGEGERKEQAERLKAEVVAMVARKLVDPNTLAPYPADVVEKALDILAKDHSRMMEEAKAKAAKKAKDGGTEQADHHHHHGHHGHHHKPKEPKETKEPKEPKEKHAKGKKARRASKAKKGKGNDDDWGQVKKEAEKDDVDQDDVEVDDAKAGAGAAGEHAEDPEPGPATEAKDDETHLEAEEDAAETTKAATEQMQNLSLLRKEAAIWSGVVLTKSAKSLALDAMRALVSHQPIPVMRARLKVQVHVPAGSLKTATKEKMLTLVEPKGRTEDYAGGASGTDEWELMGYIDPGAHKPLQDIVAGKEFRGRGRFVVVGQAEAVAVEDD